MPFCPGASSKALRLFVGSCGLASLLGGCVDTMSQSSLARGDVKASIALGKIHSPRAAAVTLSSLQGPPEAVAARFRQQVTAEAGARDMTVTDPGQARYFLRGYLDAYSADSGTAVSYVWDVFDSEKRRILRLADTIQVRTQGGDPWATIDDATLAALAGRSADDLALCLAETPEAMAGTLAPAVAGGAAPDQVTKAVVVQAAAETPPLLNSVTPVH